MKKFNKKEFIAIQAHINRNYKRWFKTYSGVEGVHIGEKKINDKEIDNFFSIVFHVNKKNKYPEKIIPPNIYVTVGKNSHKVKISTDIIEAGELKYNGIKIGDRTKNQNLSIFGTISLYFSINERVYVGSNMHVLAPHLINNSKFRYDVRKGDTPQIILISNGLITSTAELIVGIFNNIDFGFARIDDPLTPTIIENVISEVGIVNGFFNVNKLNFQTIDSSFYGTSSHLTKCRIMGVEAIKNTRFPHIYMTNLLRLEKKTIDGDSGAPVFNDQNRLLGVVIGSDKNYSYAIHINDIINYFQTSKL